MGKANINTSCILNREIKPNLEAQLVKLMQTSFFILVTGGNNDQNLQKINPVTVRIFKINQQRIVTQFFDMCLSGTATADFLNYWKCCPNTKFNEQLYFTGIDNTSVNVGLYDFLIVKFRNKNQNCVVMCFPCHIARNTALQAVTKAFCKVFGDWLDVNHFF